jgi:hypothetical protein
MCSLLNCYIHIRCSMESVRKIVKNLKIYIATICRHDVNFSCLVSRFCSCFVNCTAVITQCAISKISALLLSNQNWIIFSSTVYYYILYHQKIFYRAHMHIGYYTRGEVIPVYRLLDDIMVAINWYHLAPIMITCLSYIVVPLSRSEFILKIIIAPMQQLLKNRLCIAAGRFLFLLCIIIFFLR